MKVPAQASSFTNERLSHTLRRLVRALSCAIALTFSSACMASSSLLEDIAKLDNEYIEVSSTFFQDRRLYSSEALQRASSVAQLQTLVDQYASRSDDITAIRLLYANESAFMDSLDSKAVFRFLEIFLRNNDRKMADKIVSQLMRDGDTTLTPTVNFLFAKYYADRGEWEKVHNLLSGRFSQLATEDAAYAYLLDGVALQHLTKHRQAIKLYEKIPSSSRYYPEAQLNTAVASIRQDWWTDAEVIVKRLEESAPGQIDSE